MIEWHLWGIVRECRGVFFQPWKTMFGTLSDRNPCWKYLILQNIYTHLNDSNTKNKERLCENYNLNNLSNLQIHIEIITHICPDVDDGSPPLKLRHGWVIIYHKKISDVITHSYLHLGYNMFVNVVIGISSFSRHQLNSSWEIWP